MRLLAMQAEAQSRTNLEVVDRLQAPPAPPPVKMRLVSFAIMRDSDDKPYAMAPRYGKGTASSTDSGHTARHSARSERYSGTGKDTGLARAAWATAGAHQQATSPGSDIR